MPALSHHRSVLCHPALSNPGAAVFSIEPTAAYQTTALFDLMKTLPAALQSNLYLEGVIAFAGKVLPFLSLNFGWVVPAAIGFVLGMVLRGLRKDKKA